MWNGHPTPTSPPIGGVINVVSTHDLEHVLKTDLATPFSDCLVPVAALVWLCSKSIAFNNAHSWSRSGAAHLPIANGAVAFEGRPEDIDASSSHQ